MVRCVAINKGMCFNATWCGWHKLQQLTSVASERVTLAVINPDRKSYVPRSLHRCLKYSLDKQKIRSQDTLDVIAGIASDPQTWRMAWDFVRKNWDILYQRYEDMLSIQARNAKPQIDIHERMSLSRVEDWNRFTSGIVTNVKAVVNWSISAVWEQVLACGATEVSIE